MRALAITPFDFTCVPNQQNHKLGTGKRLFNTKSYMPDIFRFHAVTFGRFRFTLVQGVDRRVVVKLNQYFVLQFNTGLRPLIP